MFGSLVSLNGQDYTLQLHEDCGKINYLSASLLYHLYNSQSTYLLRRYVGAQTSKCQQLHSLLTLTVMSHTIVNINIAITFTNIITMPYLQSPLTLTAPVAAGDPGQSPEAGLAAVAAAAPDARPAGAPLGDRITLRTQ